MGDKAVKRLWMFNHRRREKIDFGQQLPTETIPAHKAGGIAAVGAWPAVMDWFIRDCADRFGSLEDGRLGEDAESGWTDASSEAVADLESYADVTLQIYDQLLESERLATPEDFQGIEYTGPIPLGYDRNLRDIWLKQHR
jgi:hypothetical protein